MPDTRAESRHEDAKVVRPLNPADPFLVRHATGQRSVTVSSEQRQALRRVRDASGHLPRRELRTDLLISLLRARMISIHADAVELTVLGALAVSTPV
jgi:hypothetical protein